jgi:hypothetical protein
MPINRRTGVLAVAASLTLAALAAPTTGIAAGIVPDSGVQTVSVPAVDVALAELVPAGQLKLTTTNGTPGTGSVEFVDLNNKRVGDSQQLTESGSESCKTLGTNPTLLAFDGVLTTTPGKPVGFSKGSIGVKETSSETFCNQIDTTSPTTWLTGKFVPETLVLTLNSGLTDPDFGTLKATSASLDVELVNKDSSVLVTAKLDGATQATYTLKTGKWAVPGTDLAAATKGSNVQWQVGAPDDGVIFDSLWIATDKGAVSLEGGADLQTPPTQPTTITLGYVGDDVVEGCDALVPGGGNTARVQYLGSVSADEPCDSFNVVLSATNDEVRLLKPRDPANPDAQFIFDLTWTLPVGTFSPAALPKALINFELADSIDNTLPFCPPTAYVGEDLKGFTSLAGIDDFEDRGVPGSEGTQYGCVGGRLVTSDGTTLTIRDKVLTVGDLRMTLGK